MSSEIEDTLLATDEGAASDSSQDAVGETALAETQLGSEDSGAGTDAEEAALAQTQAHPPGGDLKLPKTQTGRPSQSVWIPLSMRKADLPTVGRDTYEVGHELARGGMGRILSAQDTRLGRPVAIKELLRGSVAARARFVREACITARLQHPAIVPLYEAGHWPNGEPFFAMKMVKGEALDTVAQRCKTTEARLALLGRVLDVADALAYAHSKEVIHRDLKPANVLVGDFGETVVIDWGLAKHLDRDDEADLFDREAAKMSREAETLDGEDDKPTLLEGDSNALTIMGQAMGTPSYMAPEQARGEKVDKRADVYSLGAILYQVLSGKVAYSGSKSAAEVLGKVLQGPPTPLDQITDGLAPPLLTIVNKAMARDPDDRYQDASVFADELRSYQAGNLVSAHQYSTSALLWRWVQTHRTLMVSATVMILCGVVATAISYRSIGIERDKAMKQMDRAEAQTKIAKKGSLELALNIASDQAEKRPLEAIRDLHEMQDLGEFPEALARARMIASEARAHRIPRELAARGSNHGTMVLSPDDSTLAIAWHKRKVALMNLDSRTTIFLEGDSSDEKIRNIAYSPNGKMLVVERSGHAGSVRIWKLDGSGESFELSDRQAPDVQFSPDGRWLATRFSSRLRLYDLSSMATAKETARELNYPHTGQMHFSPDSKLLAFVEQDLRIYDIEADESKIILVGGPKPNFPGRRETVSRIRFSPDGTKLVLVGPDVSVYDLATQEIEPLFKPSGKVKSIALSSNSKTLAAGTEDGAIYLYDFPATDHSLNTLSGHAKEIKWVQFTDGNRRLVSAGEGGELRLWDIGMAHGRSFFLDQAPEIIASSLGHGVPLLFHDESKIVAHDRVGYLRVWSRLRPDVHALSAPSFLSSSLFSIGSDLMAWSSGGNDYEVHITTTEDESRVLGSLGTQVAALAMSSDDRHVAAGGDILKLWNLDSGESKTLEGHEGIIRFLAFVDNKLFSVDDRGQVYSWELSSGKRSSVAEHEGRIGSGVNVAIDPAGRWLVTSGSRSNVFLHNLRDGSKRLLATGDRVGQGVAVSRDGELVAMALPGAEVAVFSTLKDEEPMIVRSPDNTEELLRPEFSPDDKALVVSSGSLGVRLWPDWRNSHESRLMRANDRTPVPRFSEDGEFIIAPGSRDGVASIWHVGTGQRRDMRGQAANIKAEFWPGRDRVVISDRRGVVSILLDDMPRDWPALQAWIQQTLRDKSLVPSAP